MRFTRNFALLEACQGPYLYGLQLAQNHIFIGTTTNLVTELRQIWAGKTNQSWLQAYPVQGILELRQLTGVSATGQQFQATQLTLEYMQRYGIEQVRGGELTAYALSQITNQLILPDFSARYPSVQQILQQVSMASLATPPTWVIFILALKNQQYLIGHRRHQQYLSTIKAWFTEPAAQAPLAGQIPIRVAEQTSVKSSEPQVLAELQRAAYQRLAAKVGAENILIDQPLSSRLRYNGGIRREQSRHDLSGKGY